MKASRGKTIGKVTVAAIVTMAILAPVLAPYDPSMQLDLVALKNSAPSFLHPLGTDSYSRDVLSRAMFGARTSLIVSMVAAAIATVIGIVWGSVAAVAGGSLGEIMMGAVDVIRSVPRMLVLLAAAVIMGALGSLQLGVLLGLTAWSPTARLVYTLTRTSRALPFVEAARALGNSPSRVLGSHVFPQLAGALAASSALLVADLIALEAALSFIGLGVQPPTASWGSMIQDAIPYLESAWWVAAVPCAFVIITVLSASSSMDSMGMTGQENLQTSRSARSSLSRWRIAQPLVRKAPANSVNAYAATVKVQ